MQFMTPFLINIIQHWKELGSYFKIELSHLKELPP